MPSLVELLELAENYNHELPALPPALQLPQGAQIAAWIDHTMLKPEATAAQIKRLCQEAVQFNFASVCVNQVYVPLAVESLAGNTVKVCCTVGFPFGATSATVKLFETLACVEAGASEVDMVINIGALKGQEYGQVFNEVLALAQVCHNQHAILKVILEMALLTHQEKIIGCLISQAAGADFVKTSTGYGPGGATIEDVELMYRVVGPGMKVKAAGGIRNLQTALAMIGAGASRLGASAGVQIVQEAVASN
jgi:deoxyribose-phosphate aldolase